MIRLKFHDSRSGKKELFQPIETDNVRMYVCGPTVYDRAHIGNARPSVVFDVLFRVLQDVYGSGNVTYVRNITDVDDKINARALALKHAGDGRTLTEIVKAVTDETIHWYREDMKALSVLPPSHEPRATEFVSKMVELVSCLVGKGFAYSAEGHVLFSVGAYDGYGEFSRRSLDDMLAGARVEVAPYKKDPLDFVLWKPSTPDEPGWESPWGRGRPGWHIECSAMTQELLGQSFDIHAGGADLVFPHHENEVAQSLCANPGSEFARYWMHNALLLVDGRKMAKSLGNFFTIKDLLDRGIDGGAIRLTLLSTHYRHPLDWTERKLQDNCRTLERWRQVTRDIPEDEGEVSPEIMAALSDDLNTPRAIAELHRLAKSGDHVCLKMSAGFLGLLDGECRHGSDRLPPQVRNCIEELLSERAEARASREFARADHIRDCLVSAGVEIKDGPQGTDWCLTSRFDPARLKSGSRSGPPQQGDLANGN